jgi:hypothetical protein
MMMNVYGYAGSHPTTYSDPTGRAAMMIADCPDCTKPGGPLGPPAKPPTPVVIAEHIVKNGLPQTVSELTNAYGSVNRVSSSIDWFAVWTEVNALFAAESPETAKHKLKVSESVGWGISSKILETGGYCYWDADWSLRVCWGGISPASWGGTTFGHTFVSRKKDASGNLINPMVLKADSPDEYAKLMEHERNHALQWDYYGLDMAKTLPYAFWDSITGLPHGCENPWEISADLVKGKYTGC